MRVLGGSLHRDPEAVSVIEPGSEWGLLGAGGEKSVFHGVPARDGGGGRVALELDFKK